MRTTLTLLAVGAALTGCRPDFDTLQEACPSSVAGSGKAPQDAVDAVLRGNCYRRLAGQAASSVDSRYAASSRAHARYVDQHGFAGGQEDPTQSGFTGETTADRLKAQGYELPIDYEQGIFFWTLALDTAGPIPAEIDLWMDHYLSRQVVLQPGVMDSGYGRSGSTTVFENMSPFPSNDRVDKPFVYPKDGQTNVPTSVVQGFPGEAVPAGGIMGYPITITVSSAETSGDLSSENPYGLTLLEQRVLDPDNRQVAMYEIQPQTTIYPFPFSVALVPQEPLKANTTYRVFARVSWADGIANVESIFTTGTDGAATQSPDQNARTAAEQRSMQLRARVVPAERLSLALE